MIQLVRPTGAMKEQAIEFRQEFFEDGEFSSTEVNYMIKRMITQNGADPQTQTRKKRPLIRIGL